jgi:hypothetical protein
MRWWARIIGRRFFAGHAADHFHRNFLPLEVALNRVWGFRNNRSYLGNQLISLGLVFACGSLALLSVGLTAGNVAIVKSALHGYGAWYVELVDFVTMKVFSILASIAIFFLVYWLLPNGKVPARGSAAGGGDYGIALGGAEVRLYLRPAAAEFRGSVWAVRHLGQPDVLVVSVGNAAADGSASVGPDSPHRHDVGTGLTGVKAGTNRRQPERSAGRHFLRHPSPRKQTSTLLDVDNAVTGRKWTVCLGLRLCRTLHIRRPLGHVRTPVNSLARHGCPGRYRSCRWGQRPSDHPYGHGTSWPRVRRTSATRAEPLRHPRCAPTPRHIPCAA